MYIKESRSYLQVNAPAAKALQVQKECLKALKKS
jgi:hypothetical protein